MVSLIFIFCMSLSVQAMEQFSNIRLPQGYSTLANAEEQKQDLEDIALDNRLRLLDSGLLNSTNSEKKVLEKLGLYLEIPIMQTTENKNIHDLERFTQEDLARWIAEVSARFERQSVDYAFQSFSSGSLECTKSQKDLADNILDEMNRASIAKNATRETEISLLDNGLLCTKSENDLAQQVLDELQQTENGNQTIDSNDEPLKGYCHKCNKEYSSIEKFRRHIEYNCTEKVCEFCQSNCKSVRQYQSHLQDKHPDQFKRIKPFHCNECNNDYASEKRLKNHICRDFSKLIKK